VQLLERLPATITPRESMVAASRAAAGMGYVGYPAHIFYMKIYLDRQETHFKRLWTLEQWYSDLRGYLPLLFEKDAATYNEILFPKITSLDERIDDAWEDYQQRFDNPDTWDPAELQFNKKVKMILRDLDEVTAMSKVIDKQKMNDDMEAIG
jgi:hypothetical protein